MDKTDSIKTYGAFMIVVIVTFICFMPGLNNEFVLTWDDGAYIVYNNNIKELSPHMLRWAFTEFYASYWAPLTWISYALDFAIWGSNPVGYHLSNNIIHSINAGMFFILSLALLKRYRIDTPDASTAQFLTKNYSMYCALLAAFVFAIHPLRVESVAWATERKDVLSLFFGLPAMLFYLKHTEYTNEHPGFRAQNLSFLSSGYYWVSVVFFCLSLLSKSMLVSMPLVLLVLDWFPLRRLNRSNFICILIEKAPFILLSGMAAILTVISQSSALMPYEESNLPSRALIAGKSIVTYLWMTVYPTNLSHFYLHPGNVSITRFEYLFPVPVILLITGCCVYFVKRYPLFMTTWLIYLITLFPVLGFTYGGNTAMADRFTYVPGLAVSLFIAICIVTVLERYSRSRPMVILITTMTLFMLLAATYLTIRQISYWKDDVALWSRAIEVKPHFSGRTYFQRGKSYAARGEYQRALDDVNEAIAIATKKKHREMHTIFVERARILRQMGNIQGAISDYTSAISSDTSPSRSMYYLERGKLYREIGRTDLADNDFKMVDGGK